MKKSVIIGIIILAVVIISGIVVSTTLMKGTSSDEGNNISNSDTNKTSNKVTNIKAKIGDKVAYSPSTIESESYDCPAFNVRNGYSEITKKYKPEKQTWIYLGTDENGNLTLTTEKAVDIDYSIGGTIGYLKGISKLDEICSILYGNNTYGTARSIKKEDVVRVLDYSGSQAQFCDKDLKWQDTPIDSNGEFITIGELSKTQGNITNTKTPDDTKKLDEYISNGYQIHKESKEINKDNIDIIYPYHDEYWIASNNVFASYYTDTVSFGLTAITGVFGMKGIQLFVSNGSEESASYGIRPCIVLNSDVTFGDKNSNGEWTLIQK